MTNYVTRIYSDEHPDFDKLSILTAEKGLVAGSFTNMLQDCIELEAKVEELEQEIERLS
ncbi:hypothetical protein LVJ82_01120 [Vitreoscilla massiliensis]|uniref:Uncharacterized protein n=1 Tax=Vitreoscilla massiliensis TaxID=1689272 RepID=A0ABY4E2M5_9NEIS|nr:hypothetical protein [Vitreoscilla massiliensis]UOO89616.1 hypothetical protein LVJ82_01120 [Vitreoscilla massiliensis]